MLIQVVLFIITLVIYAIYWFYSTLKELHTANGKDEGAGCEGSLALIPFANLYAQWHYSSEFSPFAEQRDPAILIFIAWLVFSPAVWFLARRELNKAVSAG